jgi:hypothetical protein
VADNQVPFPMPRQPYDPLPPLAARRC